MPTDILIVTADAALLDELLRLAAAADAEARVVSDAARARSAWREATFVVVGADLAAELARSGVRRRQGVVLAGVAGDGDQIYRRAVDIGAQQVALLPDRAAWLVEQLATAAEPPREHAAVIAVMAGRGGAGASVLAATLAGVAAHRGLRTLLLDGDPLGGGIDLVLGVEGAPGARWSDYADRQGRLSGAALHDSLPERGGLAVLSWHRGAVEPVAARTMRSVLEAAARGYGLIVADLPRQITDASAEVLAVADMTLLVIPAEVRATVAADRVADLVRGHTTDIRIVVRGPAPGGLDAAVIAQSLRLPLAGVITTDRRLAAAIERGDAPRRGGSLGGLCVRLLTEFARVRPQTRDGAGPWAT